MKKILIIEDTKSVRREISFILKYEDYQVFEAENGIIGVEIAKNELPDLIICDILMPELDGYGVLNELSKDLKTASIPFIFLTAKVTNSDLRHGMNLGADDYITKPFTRTELVDVIKIRLRKAANADKKFQEKFQTLNHNISYALPHELNTPLTTILGCAELIIDTTFEKQTKEMAESITVSSKRIEKLIKNFLIHAQIELLANNPTNLISLQDEYISNPGEIITEMAIIKAEKMNRENDLILKTNDSEVQITSENLSKIMEEIIDNAFKFSVKGQPVEIQTFQNSNYFLIQITNQGRGMLPEQIKNIGAYMQFDRKIYEQQGMGLGLIIAKKLVELHNGILEIESDKDKKTKIEIYLRSKL